MKSCDVILATYNGEDFISALLESLLVQEYTDFRVLVRDDGSSDKTLDIIAEFQPRFSGRLSIVGDGFPTGSPTLNFEILMKHSTADYILFCDQDDVWLPNRVSESIAMLVENESIHGQDTPIFVFNDLIPVDRNLKPIAKSFWEFKKIDPKTAKQLGSSLITSPILGCSSGINRALLLRSLPIHFSATNHDWWMLHVAIIFGKVAWSPKKTVLYRLHGGNSSNQKRVSLMDYVRARDRFARVRNGLTKKVLHSKGLLDQYSTEMPFETRKLFEDFVGIQKRGFIRKRWILLKWGLGYPDLRRKIIFFLSI